MWRALKRLDEPFRSFGPWSGLLYVADRLLRRLSPRLNLNVYEFVMQPVPEKPLLTPRLAANLRFAEVGPDDDAIARMPAPPEVKAARFAQGARCIGMWRKEEFAGFLWFCGNGYVEDEVRCVYSLAEPQTSVFDFDVYVMPQHRKSLAFVGLWHGANQRFREAGVVRSYSRISRFNLASRSAHARMGAQRVGFAVFFVAWGLELMLASVSPYLALTWRGRAPVRLHLPTAPVGPSAANPDTRLYDQGSA